MIKVFDYKCLACGLEEERYVKQEEMEEQKCECGGEMKRLPAATRTNWDRNPYEEYL